MDLERSRTNSSIHLLTNTDAENNCDIEELLKPINSLDLDSESDYSDIQDIFEEFHKDSFLRPNADASKKHLTKIEADWKTVERFTEDFKKTMNEIKENSQTRRSLLEEEEELERFLASPPVVLKPNIPRRESPIVIEKEKDEDSETSSQSLVWQRLLKNSEGRFKVSPPVFDAFRQEEKHWLERPSISWKIVDDCRVKCDQWLDEVLQIETQAKKKSLQLLTDEATLRHKLNKTILFHQI